MKYYILVRKGGEDIRYIRTRNNMLPIFTSRKKAQDFVEKNKIQGSEIWNLDSHKNREFLTQNKIVVDPKS